YYLKDVPKWKKQKRKGAERAAARKNEPPPFPSPEQLRAEAEEEEPAVLVTVTDAEGKPVRTLTAPAAAGFQRVSWDLRAPAPVLPQPTTRRGPRQADEDEFGPAPGGPLVPPGRYQVTLAQRVDGAVTPLAGPQEFSVVLDPADTTAEADLKALAEFQREAVRL